MTVNPGALQRGQFRARRFQDFPALWFYGREICCLSLH
jgi:hypothetical protein